MPEPATLLDRIEQEAIKPDCEVASVLRMCVALGGQSGSADLRSWASRELKGYEPGASLPDYRTIGAVLAVDGFTATHRIQGEQIARYSLPEPARSQIEEVIELRGPIAELVDVIARARASGDDDVKFAIPGGAELTILMNADMQRRGVMTRRVERVYKRSSVTAVVGVIDSVLTNLVELVAEIRAGLGPGEIQPGKELTDRAFNIVVNGEGNRIEIGTHHTVVQDSTNVAIDSQGAIQTALFTPGDLDALKDALAVAGLSRESVDELTEAIHSDEDDVTATERPGPKVRSWIGGLAIRSASAIGTGVSVEVIVELIKHFFAV